jgi:hypothetical protein
MIANEHSSQEKDNIILQETSLPFEGINHRHTLK